MATDETKPKRKPKISPEGILLNQEPPDDPLPNLEDLPPIDLANEEPEPEPVKPSGFDIDGLIQKGMEFFAGLQTPTQAEEWTPPAEMVDEPRPVSPIEEAAVDNRPLIERLRELASSTMSVSMVFFISASEARELLADIDAAADMADDIRVLKKLVRMIPEAK